VAVELLETNVRTYVGTDGTTGSGSSPRRRPLLGGRHGPHDVPPAVLAEDGRDRRPGVSYRVGGGLARSARGDVAIEVELFAPTELGA
jgi:hypothetical protein